MSLCVCVQYTGWGRVALAAIVWVACMCGGRGYTAISMGKLCCVQYIGLCVCVWVCVL